MIELAMLLNSAIPVVCLSLLVLLTCVIDGKPTLSGHGSITTVHEEILAENYIVQWEPNYETEIVTFRVIVGTLGYVGFGISSLGGMNEADIVIGGIDDQGEYFQDYHGVIHTPVVDETQDWVLTASTENDTHTELTFSRTFDTGDDDDAVINYEETNFIWAIGSSDSIVYHGFRGSKPARILFEPESTEDPCDQTGVVEKEEWLADNYFVQWAADIDLQEIEFHVVVGTIGYVGLGLSRTGDMTRAEIVIGGVHDNQTSYFKAYHGIATAPIEDEIQDEWALLSFHQNETHTELRFSRRFDTGDENDIPVTADPIFLIWSFREDDEVWYHGPDNRGQKLVTLLDPPQCTPPTTTVEPEPEPDPCTEAQELVINELYSVRWINDYSAQTIQIQVTALTTGYVGFGISNGGGMNGADIVIGGVLPNGESYFQDYHGVGYTPTVDESQDWVLISASEDGTHTKLTFSRAFDSGDENDTSITVDPTNFIWSMGQTDEIVQHSISGSKPITILNPACVPTPTPGPVPCIQPEQELVLSENYVLRWSSNHETRTVQFRATVATTGYVGLGISNGGGMTGADIVIGGVRNGERYFEDYHGVGSSSPVRDESQDWVLISAFDNGTHTDLVFSRSFDTGDENDTLITEDNTNFIWAHGGSDDIGYHFSNKGSVPVNILDSEQCTTEPTQPPPTTPELPTTILEPCIEEHELAINENYTLLWRNDYSTQTVQIQVTAATTGFVGFGISNGGGMNGADIVIGGVLESGESYFQDYHGVGYRPTLDNSQDWILISASEEGAHTKLTFSRLFDSGDENDTLITDALTNFIWAIGETDTIGRHLSTNRGSTPVVVLNPLACSTPEPSTTPSEPVDPCEQQELAPHENYTLRWTNNYSTQTIQVEIVAATTGYVGFGISNGGRMDGADIVIGGVLETGESYFQDYHGVGHTPTVDDSQDWVLISASEAGGHTSLVFSRAFDSGDENDTAITDEPTNFIWAIGGTDDIRRHTIRGSIPVTVLNPACTPTPTPGPPGPCIQPEQELMLTENYVLRWSSNHETQTVQFRAIVATTGYVGLGISNDGGMTGADVAIGGVRNGQRYLGDYHGVGSTAPVVDESQDWVIISAVENGTHTDLVFSRLFNTGDEHDTVITEQNTNFIWAVGGTDDIQYHGVANRGSVSVKIIDSTQCTTEPPPTTTLGPCVFAREEVFNENYTVRWKSDFPAQKVEFHVIVATKGYIGFGISDGGGMIGADLIIGGVLRNGRDSYFSDYHAIANGYPLIDYTSQDWALTGLGTNETHTELIFERAFDTGDIEDDVPITDAETYFIWAFGEQDESHYHGEQNRGSRKVRILEPTNECPLPTTTTTTTTTKPGSASSTFSSLLLIVFTSIALLLHKYL